MQRPDSSSAAIAEKNKELSHIKNRAGLDFGKAKEKAREAVLLLRDVTETAFWFRVAAQKATEPEVAASFAATAEAHEETRGKAEAFLLSLTTPF